MKNHLFTHENIFRLIMAGMTALLITGMGWIGNKVVTLQRIVFMEKSQMEEIKKTQEATTKQWKYITTVRIDEAVTKNDIEWLKWLAKGGGKK